MSDPPATNESERRCAVCRTARPTSELVRFGQVGGQVAPVSGKGGRGAHVCVARTCLDALTSGSLSRAFKGPVSDVDAKALVADLHSLAERRVLETIGLARRQRMLDYGVDKLPWDDSDVILAVDLSERSDAKFGAENKRFIAGDALGRAAGMGWVGAMLIRPGSLADRAAYWLALWYETRPFDEV